ncbi:MAG: bifunctional folylpolyglutamate synthase/dihydrofolate synthase [Bacteroidaceae bacterium]|nr:bifunctional folylpolyglutamate synthase/dihydrofolate synthase [Bacteroidaceae bacterium]
MTYEETIDYLFNIAPLFQNIGAGAYKEGLDNSLKLDEHFGHPHKAYKCIHVGGTNGKGSVSHTLAAILQSAGYRVGLYTSPHLMDFRERIKVNGEMIPEERVIRFVEEEREFFEPLHPSFFELTTALALKYFQEEGVDWAVIEVGLGGRLDCTNIITPKLAIITNISKDHTQFLGDTLTKIASEKAGIMKPHVPTLIGEAADRNVREVFINRSIKVGSALHFAEEEYFPYTEGELKGTYQEKNQQTIRAAASLLKLDRKFVEYGLQHVIELTGLKGRWQIICDAPLTICDTGHNPGAWQYLGPQLKTLVENKKHTHNQNVTLHMVIGMVSDKDIRSVLSMMPHEARYYFTQASVHRAMPAEDIAALGREARLEGSVYPTVTEAFAAARTNAKSNDVIFIGGSTFVVADFLKNNKN